MHLQLKDLFIIKYHKINIVYKLYIINIYHKIIQYLLFIIWF